ncbi:hypothetical protein AB0945_32885 [Streptomyces sp. NPDC005474]|uniref:ComEC/Rec2 family competence protein n=1 Tax=Streptomyces sp. NPDC005474 TaxID=3154878 RepID=UPI003453DE2F
MEAARKKAAADELEAKRLKDLRDRPPARPGNRGDGSLHVAFIRVGQGDCAVMSTPRGTVIMFDCGSDSMEDEAKFRFQSRVRKVLTGPKFLGTSNKVDILILTHPDTDHYNKLQSVLPLSCEIEKCYHSAPRSMYSADQTSAFLARTTADSAVLEVVVNDDRNPKRPVPGEISLNGIPVAAAVEDSDPEKRITVDRLDGKGGILIVDEENCKVSIVAAGVQHNYRNDSSNETNRGSIVTLVEANGVKLLMCGDATTNTEQFLINTAEDRLTDLTLVQAGHHGSINTSSSQDFIDMVNPIVVVASAGKLIPMHHLPSKEVITRYDDKLSAEKRATTGNHETFCWAPAALKSYVDDSVWTEQQVYTTGSYDTVYQTFPAAT